MSFRQTEIIRQFILMAQLIHKFCRQSQLTILMVNFHGLITKETNQILFGLHNIGLIKVYLVALDFIGINSNGCKDIGTSPTKMKFMLKIHITTTKTIRIIIIILIIVITPHTIMQTKVVQTLINTIILKVESKSIRNTIRITIQEVICLSLRSQYARAETK